MLPILRFRAPHPPSRVAPVRAPVSPILFISFFLAPFFCFFDYVFELLTCIRDLYFLSEKTGSFSISNIEKIILLIISWMYVF